MTYPNGTKVKYDNGVIKGEGVVVGYSVIEQSVIGATAIVEDQSGNIPNASYPYTHFACAEIHLKPVFEAKFKTREQEHAACQ